MGGAHPADWPHPLLRHMYLLTWQVITTIICVSCRLAVSATFEVIPFSTNLITHIKELVQIPLLKNHNNVETSRGCTCTCTNHIISWILLEVRVKEGMTYKPTGCPLNWSWTGSCVHLEEEGLLVITMIPSSFYHHWIWMCSQAASRGWPVSGWVVQWNKLPQGLGGAPITSTINPSSLAWLGLVIRDTIS